MKYKLFILLTITLFSFSSCNNDAEIWDSSTVDYAGDWYVKYNLDGEEDAFGLGYTALTSFNTAANDGSEIWMTDNAKFWDYKVRVIVSNSGDLTFGSQDTVINNIDGYPIKIVVSNGEIFKDASIYHPSGAIADSIYFEIWFEDIDGAGLPADQKLIVEGYRKTGFNEDEP